MATQQISKARLSVGITNQGIDLGKCATFNGTTSAISFTIPTSFNPANLPRFTVAAWVDFNSIGENNLGRILAFGFLEIFYDTSTTMRFSVAHSVQSANAFMGVPLNGWHRVLVQWDDEWDFPRVFIDGAESIGTPTNKSGVRANVSGGTAYIGNNSTNQRTADGEIDQVDVWNRVLTYDEIVDDWYFANRIDITGKIFSLPMNEASGDYVDTEGGIVCTPSNVTQNVTSYSTDDIVVPARSAYTDRHRIRDFGTSLRFDGVGDYANFGNIYNTFFSGMHSVSAWIYPTRLNTAMSIVTKQRRSTPFNGHGFYTSSTGQLSFQYITTQTTNQFIAATDNPCLKINMWQYVAMVYDNKTIAFYVNGILIPSTISSNNVSSSYSTTANFNIGGRNNDEGVGDNDFFGLIDDVKFWNANALTAKQMKDECFNGSCGITPSSYWNMDEASGSTVEDQIDSLDGTINGAVYSDIVFMNSVRQSI